VARRKKKLSPIYVVSLVAHLAVGGALALVPQQKLREVVAIALNEPPPKEEKKAEPPKPKPHPAEAPQRAARAVHHEPVTATPSGAANDAAPVFQNLGLMLDSSSSDGLAVRVAPPPPPPVAPPAPATPKLLGIRHAEVECPHDDLQKARPLGVVRPSYTDEARRARVQGRVRIELAVDDHGQVSDARLLEGLGYGLDEAALEAARRLRFAPAMRCSRPIAAPFVIAMRFVLGT
jgi:protein TonB